MAKAAPGEPFRVLGFDPALATFGHGVVDVSAGVSSFVASGVFGTEAKAPMGERVDDLIKHIDGLITRYKPNAVSAESFVWYGRGAGAGTHVMRVCGALRAVCLLRRVPLSEYQARAIKQCVTGSANGEKDAVQRAVASALKLDAPPRTSHEADALGAALTHIHALSRSVVILTAQGDTFGNGDKVLRKRKAKKDNGRNQESAP